MDKLKVKRAVHKRRHAKNQIFYTPLRYGSAMQRFDGTSCCLTPTGSMTSFMNSHKDFYPKTAAVNDNSNCKFLLEVYRSLLNFVDKRYH